MLSRILRMKIKVELHGRLSKHIPDYDPDNGAEIEIPDGGNVGDLFTILNITTSEGCVVLLDGRIMSPGDKLHDNASVTVLEALQGG
jgi:sulfur carrier protein ThiS